MPQIHPNDAARDASGKRTAIALTLAFIGIVGLLLVPIPIHSRASVACSDLVHAPLFGLITFVILLLLRQRFDRAIPLRIVFSIAVMVCGFGVAIELIQSVSGRMANVHDAVNNTYGVIAAVLCYFAYAFRRQTPATALCLLAVAVVVMAIAWRPPMTIIYDATKARWEFPILASFDSEAELGRFHFHQCAGRLTETDATDGRYAMEITFDAQKYPGARLHEFNPDWSDVGTLEMDLRLDESYPQQVLRMMVKVIDRERGKTNEDYFWRWVDLERGIAKHVSYTRDQLESGPSHRQLDLSQIVAINLLAVEPSAKAIVRVDAIRLVLR